MALSTLNPVSISSTLPAVPYEHIHISHVDISAFGGGDDGFQLPHGNRPCELSWDDGEHANGIGIYFYAQQPANLAEAARHFRDLVITDADVHHNEVAGVVFDDSYGFCHQEHAAAHEQVLLDRVDAYDQKPRDQHYAAPVPPVLAEMAISGTPYGTGIPQVGAGQGISLGSVAGGVVQHSRAYRNGRPDYYVFNGGDWHPQ